MFIATIPTALLSRGQPSRNKAILLWVDFMVWKQGECQQNLSRSWHFGAICPFFLRFFEFGSANIPAMPFLRPAARKANKVFVDYMGEELDGKIRRKARVRR